MIAPQEEILIADIDKELKSQREAQEAKNQIRASLFNLILYSHEPRRAAYLHDFIQTIVEKFPCRILFIEANRAPAQNYLRVSVSNVVTSKGEVTIACDEINIAVTSSQMLRVPYILLPHLLADLPIYLLWGQDPTGENEIFPVLQRIADRLIIDSECAQDLPRFSAALLEMIADSTMEISDMNWAAISPWRNCLARVFDSQERVFQLHEAKRVSILYNATKSDWIHYPEIQSLYLQAWVAAQMEWRLVEADLKGPAKIIKYFNGAQEATVELIPKEEEATTPGTLLNIDIEIYGDTLFSIARKARLPQVVVHISTLQECEMPFSLPLSDSRKTLAFLRNVLYRPAGNHYRNTLAMIGHLQGKTG